MRWAIVPCIVIGFIVGGCAHLEPRATPGGYWADWDEKAAQYRFFPGDELDVKMLHNPDLSDRVIVAPDGYIHLELLGPIKAQGLSAEELEAQLRRLYANEVKYPEVTVIPRLYGSEAFFIGGEVVTPGVFKVTPRLSFLKAVIEAGGVKDTANLEEVILIRRSAEQVPMLRVINLRGIIEGKKTDDDIPIHRFDLVFVPRSGIANADLRSKQYVKDLLPFDPGLWFGYFPAM